MMKTMTALLLTVFAGEDVQRRLDARISLDLERVKLADAIQPFRDATGLNFVVMDGGDTEINIRIRDVSSRSALRLILQPRDLSAAFENGAVVIRDRRGERDRTTLRTYDVRALILKVTDFPASEVGFFNSTLLCCFCIPDDERRSVVADESTLSSLIRAHTGGRSWDDNPNASLSPRNGRLLVRQTPAVHREIESLLRKLGN